ncbi:MFS transporter [Brevundimonas intermedia]|nr:MFS transporter [Brevundimonas intermedia]
MQTSPRATAASLTVGIVALLIAGLQPLVLGGLLREARLTEAEIGLTAMVELLTLGLTCGVAAARLKPEHIRLRLILAALAHAGVTLAGVGATGLWIIADRAAAGVFEGLMLWGTINMIVRAHNPERVAGVFATTQTLGQLVAASGLALFIVPQFGVNGALIALTGLSVLAALVAGVGPSRYDRLPSSSGGKGPINAAAVAGLVSIFLFMAFIVATWVYLEPLAARSGLTPQAAGLTISIALGAQVAGGAAATALGGRWRSLPVLLGVVVIYAAVLLVLASRPSPLVFMTAMAVFGFLWMFALPIQTQRMIEIDPTRRAALQVGAAQLLGSAFGPLCAALLVQDTGSAQALILGGAFLGLSASLLLVSARKI